MISIKKAQSGKIANALFSDTVDLITQGWNYHPNVNRFFVSDGELNITHGLTPAYLFRELPETAVMEMENNYNPTIDVDMGGFLAYVLEDQALCLYEYYNRKTGTTDSYPYVRMVKRGTEYEGYGSQDGLNWDIRGALPYPEACKWGVFLEGAEGQNLKISRLTVYGDTKIRVRALPLNCKLELWNNSFETPQLVRAIDSTNYEEDIDIFNYPVPFNGTIKIISPDGTTYAEDTHEIYGGDIYHCGNFLEVYYNDKPLEVFENDFGYLDEFYKDYKLELRNMIDVPQTNVNIEIKKYMEEFGWEWVMLYKEGGELSKTLTFDEVPANGKVEFWIRITRSSIPVYVDDYVLDFAINIW